MKAKLRSVGPFWWIVWGGVLSQLVVATALCFRDNNGYGLTFAGLTAIYLGMFAFWIWARES